MKQMIPCLKAFALVTVVGVSADVANSQPVPAPDPGTVFIFTEGRVERFVRSDGNEQIWATQKGREYTRSANPAEPILKWRIGKRTGTRKVIGNTSQLWPAKSGESARFRVLTILEDDGRKRRSIQPWSCRIDKAETVTVAAGTYTTLPIRCERYSVHTMRPLQKRTWWWSDEVGHYVKRRFENLRNGETTQYSLCATLPESSANHARIAAVLERRCQGQ